MNSLVVITHGPGIRNFVMSRFLDLLLCEGEVRVLHPFPQEILKSQCALEGDVVWERPVPYHESRFAAVVRQSVGYAQMFWADTRAMRFKTVRPIPGSWRNQFLHHCAKTIGKLSASTQGINILARFHCWLVERSPTVEMSRVRLSESRPSFIFFGHYRYRGVLPHVLAARSLGIPTVAFIFSWDNLTCKGRISSPFDHYIVWSEHMRSELLRYYPTIGPERVHVAGSPQFDAYADDRQIMGREEFFRMINAEHGRPLICYSGGTPGTCPEDQAHLRLLMSLIRSGRIEGNPQVLLRPSPGDDGRRYEDVRLDYPDLLYARPEWTHTRAGAIPTRRDTHFLVNLIRHSDLNVNVASTMTLDFAICDKPVVNVGFDIASPPPFGVPISQLYYEYEHYRPVIELGAARVARSEDELVAFVNSYLANPAQDRIARRKFVELEIGTSSIGYATERIVEILKSVSAKNMML